MPDQTSAHQNKVLPQGQVNDFLKHLIATARTIAPVRVEGGFHMYREVGDPGQVEMDYPIAYYSARRYLLPPCETLLRFRKEGDRQVVEPVVEAEDQILFGLHPCDINALWMLDAAFRDTNEDENFLARRRHTTIIGLNCLKQCDDHSFCLDMKTHRVQGDYDLFLTDIGDRYFVQVATERGAALAADLPDADPESAAAAEKAEEEKDKDFTKRIDFDTDELPALLERSYDSLIWEAIGRQCFSCGSCNLVCPTCYCFNVVDTLQLNLTEGERQRHWDSCQLAEFTEVAGGEVFRKDPSARLRHRFYRKGKFIKEMFGRPGCVGCGRCDRACTANISSVGTYNQLKGEAI